MLYLGSPQDRTGSPILGDFEFLFPPKLGGLGGRKLTFARGAGGIQNIGSWATLRQGLPSCPTRFDFWMLVHRWSRSGLLLDTPNRSPICQFWYPRVLGSPHTTRKPLLLLRISALLLLREAERQFLGLLFHEPPRFECLPQN